MLKQPIGWRSVSAAILIVFLAWGAFWGPTHQGKSLATETSSSNTETGGSGDDDVIAFFTVVLAAAAWVTYFTFQRQADLMAEQIKLGRDEFISTHRPRIILREAFIGSVLEGEPIGVMMTFANIGETTGTIVRSMVDVEIVNMAHPNRLYLHGSVENIHEIGNVTLGPGSQSLISYERLAKRPNSDLATPAWEAKKFAAKGYLVRGPSGVYDRSETRYDFAIDLVGQIIYVDGSSPPVPRRTAFRRRLIPERQRFYILEDEPDLDYAD